MWSENGKGGRREKNAPKEAASEEKREIYIPEASVYDEQPARREIREGAVSQRSVTVFGYSPENLEHVMDRFRKIGEIKEISHGKNWMDIKYCRDKSMFQAMQESGSIINGEIIGVAQRGRKSVLMDKLEGNALLANNSEGIISKIFTYLFG